MRQITFGSYAFMYAFMGLVSNRLRTGCALLSDYWSADNICHRHFGLKPKRFQVRKCVIKLEAVL